MRCHHLLLRCGAAPGRDQTDPSPDHTDPIAALETKLGRGWENIRRSAATASKDREDIHRVLAADSLVSAGCSFLVFGSLARGEMTSGSDVDWTLLVDGQADPQHLEIAQAIASSLKNSNVSGADSGLRRAHI